MFEFFHGWRRKIGCLLLTMATMAMCGWMRTEVVHDTITFGVDNCRYTFISSRGGLSWHIWQSKTVPSAFQWKTIPSGGPEYDETHSRLMPSCPDIVGCVIPYWMLVTPLLSFSTYLILWRPRKERLD